MKLRKIFKFLFWLFIDYTGKIILISLVWSILSIPGIAYLYSIITEGKLLSIEFFVMIIVLTLSPFSFASSYYVLQISSQPFKSGKLNLFPKIYTKSDITLKIFFKGLSRYFFKSIGVTAISLLLLSLFYFYFNFYFKILRTKIPLLSIFVTGVLFWLFLIYLFMHIYIIPLMVSRKVNIFKGFYQSFLLVMDNFLYTALHFLFSIIMLFIFVMSVAGIFFLLYGVLELYHQLVFLMIFKKYDETMEISEEKRTFKDLIKPWASK